jgi:copper chaperone
MQSTTLRVSGMTCNGCVAHIRRALSALEGVGEIEVELPSGTVRVRHAPALSVERLVETIRDAGYPSAPAP